MDFLLGILSLEVVDPRQFLIRWDTPIVLGCFMVSNFPRQAHAYYRARGYNSRLVRHLGIEYAQIEPRLPQEISAVEKEELETEKAIAQLAELVETHAERLLAKIRTRSLLPADYAFIEGRFDSISAHPRGHPLFLVDLLTIHLRPTTSVRVLLKELRANGYGRASPDGCNEEAWDHILRNVGGVRQLPGRDFYTVAAPPPGCIPESSMDGVLCYSIERDAHTDEGAMHFMVRPADIQMYDRLDLYSYFICNTYAHEKDGCSAPDRAACKKQGSARHGRGCAPCGLRHNI